MANGDEEKKKRPGGGMPGTATGPRRTPSPKQADAKNPSEPGLVPRDEQALLDLPLTRLPIGWLTNMPADITRFRLWIPTDTGGVLEIQHFNKAQTGAKTGTVDLRKPFRKILKKAANENVYEVKPGEFGEFFVIATGKAGDTVHCVFTQVSFARDGTSDSDPPLIPWNFWYWPSADSPLNPDSTGAADILERYGTAFGHDPKACRQAEHDDHATKAVYVTPYYDWEGHCHNAAPASALFEKPQDVTYKGQKFSEADLKYLAAEYFGNFGRLEKMVWELNRGPKPGDRGGGARWYLPAYFKPDDPAKGKAALVDGLKHEYNEGLALDDPRLVEAAEREADKHINAAGGPAAFKKQVDEWMGELAAEFYQALIDNMRVKKHPLDANMRSYYVNGGPEQVWNQIYFWYHAFYQERAPVSPATPDENDILIACTLFANRDHRNDTSLPAKIISSNDIRLPEVDPTETTALVFYNLWRIIFDGKGKIVVKDARNAWQQLRNDKDEELYAPTELIPLGKIETTVKAGKKVTKFDVGNKYLGTDLLQAGLLKVRKRYQ